MGNWLFILQLQISLAVVAILLLRQAMKKMPKVYSYLLWLLVFARLLVPVTVESRFSFMPSEQEQDALMEQIIVRVTESEDGAVSGEEVQGNSEWVQAGTTSNSQFGDVGIMDGQPDNSDVTDNLPDEGNLDGTVSTAGSEIASDSVGVTGPVTVPSVTNPGNIPGREQNAEEGYKADTENAFPVWPFVILWILGGAAVLGYNGIALRKVRRSLQNAKYLMDNIQIGAGNAPVYACENINTPFSLGLFKPVIYLPAGLNAEEQEYILCHEHVHISRKDNLVKHVAFLLTAVYWFNPFVWVAFFLMERDMEMSCDEKVLKLMGGNIKRDYSQSLLNFAVGRGKMPATHLTFGENSVKQRVKNVLSYKNAKKWTIGIGAVVLLVVIVALFTTGLEESEQVDGRGDQVETDGLGQELADGSDTLNQDENNSDGNQSGDSQGNGTSNSGENQQSGNDLEDDFQGFTGITDDSSQSSKEDSGPNLADDVQDPIYVPTDEEALRKHIEKFMQENIEIAYENYDIDEQTGKAVIRYFVGENWWKKHVILETVQLVEENDKYQVVQESLTDYSTVDTGGDFEILYGTPENRNLDLVRYGDNFYRYVMQQLSAGGEEAEYFAKFTDPVLTAVELLNLGEGSGVAKREGTYAFVTYTFAKDGSTVEIPVHLVEESYGLWSVNTNLAREIYEKPTMRQPTTFGEEHGYTLEFTNFGIYRNANGVLTNIFPHYILPDLPWDERDGILYFPTEANRQEWSMDYWTNAICMLDLSTGEFDTETFSLENLSDNQRQILSVSANGGFISLICGSSYQSSTEYVIPLINTGDTPLTIGYTYNGKAVKDLTEDEQDAYGVALRDKILKTSEVLKFSNRTMTETYTYVDLDGDGKTEKIVLSADKLADGYKYAFYPYDYFKLQVGDSVFTGRKEALENDIRFFSPDGKNIVVALYGTGPSDDYTTMLYLYQDGQLQKIGEVQSTWKSMQVDQAAGVFRVENKTSDFIQPVWLWETWRINEAGQVEEVPQESYDMLYGKFELPDLLVPLPVYNAPGGEGEVTYIQPQKVDFIKMDSTRRWVYLEAADGTSGWFGFDVGRTEEGRLDLRIKGLDLKHSEIFTTYYAG